MNVNISNTFKKTNNEKTYVEMDEYFESDLTNKLNNCVINNLNCDKGNSPTILMQYLLPKIKKLQLSVEVKSTDLEQLAGYVKAIIPSTGTVVIQLASKNEILDIGTSIFVQKINDNKQLKINEYQEIGFISDIFGSIAQPMYSLQLEQKIAANTLKMDSKVFYLSNHPNTKFIGVKREANNRYSVIHH